MKTILSSLLLVLCCGPSLSAQDAEGKESKAPSGRMAWFVATAIPEDLENPVDVMTGKDITKITLSKRMASDPLKIPADGRISIVRKLEKQDDPSKPPYETLAQATIPEGMKQALVILMPVERKAGVATVFQAKVQDLAKFKGGDYLYMNLTTVNIAIQLGAKKITLKPGEITIQAAEGIDKPTNTPVSYHFFHPVQEKWKLLSASTIVLQPTRREICIFSWDPRYNRVDYHGVTFPVAP
jgi:hypothetical protein